MGEVLAAVIPSAVMCVIFVAFIRALLRTTRASKREEKSNRTGGGS